MSSKFVNVQESLEGTLSKYGLSNLKKLVMDGTSEDEIVIELKSDLDNFIESSYEVKVLESIKTLSWLVLGCFFCLLLLVGNNIFG